MAKRLLAVNMFPMAHAIDGDIGVQMIGRRADDGIDVFIHLIQHDAEVFIRLADMARKAFAVEFRVFLRRDFTADGTFVEEIVLITTNRIRHRHDAHVFKRLQIVDDAHAHAAASNQRHIHNVVRTFVTHVCSLSDNKNEKENHLASKRLNPSNPR